MYLSSHSVLYAILTSNDQLYYIMVTSIRKLYSHIAVNKLWLALEWYVYTRLWLAFNGLRAMVSTPRVLCNACNV